LEELRYFSNQQDFALFEVLLVPREGELLGLLAQDPHDDAYDARVVLLLLILAQFLVLLRGLVHLPYFLKELYGLHLSVIFG